MKKYAVVFSPRALDDSQEAAVYYEMIQQNLGIKFLHQLQLTLNSIKRNPFFSSVRYDDIRCAQIKKFPYMVHYHINKRNALVMILAVYSTHREPLY
jgi:hypothetical protein